MLANGSMPILSSSPAPAESRLAAAGAPSAAGAGEALGHSEGRRNLAASAGPGGGSSSSSGSISGIKDEAMARRRTELSDQAQGRASSPSVHPAAVAPAPAGIKDTADDRVYSLQDTMDTGAGASDELAMSSQTSPGSSKNFPVPEFSATTGAPPGVGNVPANCNTSRDSSSAATDTRTHTSAPLAVPEREADESIVSVGASAARDASFEPSSAADTTSAINLDASKAAARGDDSFKQNPDRLRKAKLVAAMAAALGEGAEASAHVLPKTRTAVASDVSESTSIPSALKPNAQGAANGANPDAHVEHHEETGHPKRVTSDPTKRTNGDRSMYDTEGPARMDVDEEARIGVPLGKPDLTWEAKAAGRSAVGGDDDAPLLASEKESSRKRKERDGENDAIQGWMACRLGRVSSQDKGDACASPDGLLMDAPLGEGWDEEGNDVSKLTNDAIRKAQCEAWTAKLRQEASAIRAGDHPEVVRRSVLTVEASKRRHQICEKNAVRQRSTAEILYQMEVKAIQDAYETAMEQTRERLMNEVNEEIRRSKSRLEGFKEVENRMNTRHTRGNAKGAIEDPWLAQTTGSKSNGNSKRPLCPVSLVLEDDDLDEDIEFLRYAGHERHNGGGSGSGGGGGGGGGSGGYGAYEVSSGVSGRARRPPAWRRDE